MEPVMLSPEQFAARLYMHTDTLRGMRKRGELPKHYAYPTPGRKAWREDDVDLFISCYRDMEKFNKLKSIDLSS